MMHVGIIIVNWNGKDDTLACLASIQKLSVVKCKLSIIVVDNGSTDGSADVIAKKFPKVNIIQTNENLGFTGGNNIGIRRALDDGCDFIWLLNNDTVADHNALMPLVESCMPETVGVVGSKIYFFPGHEFHEELYEKKDKGRVLWYAGGLVDWNNMYASHRGVDQIDTGQYETQGPTSFISGCSMLVKRSVFEKIGFLDDAFYLYYEDLDFCLRAKRAGFLLLYVPKSIIWHKNAGSTGKPGHQLHQYYLTRNRVLIGIRYASFRTKLALVKEGLKFFLSGSNIQKKAIRDAFMKRYGKRIEWETSL